MLGVTWQGGLWAPAWKAHRPHRHEHTTRCRCCVLAPPPTDPTRLPCFTLHRHLLPPHTHTRIFSPQHTPPPSCSRAMSSSLCSASGLSGARLQTPLRSTGEAEQRGTLHPPCDCTNQKKQTLSLLQTPLTGLLPPRAPTRTRTGPPGAPLKPPHPTPHPTSLQLAARGQPLPLHGVPPGPRLHHRGLLPRDPVPRGRGRHRHQPVRGARGAHEAAPPACCQAPAAPPPAQAGRQHGTMRPPRRLRLPGVLMRVPF